MRDSLSYRIVRAATFAFLIIFTLFPIYLLVTTSLGGSDATGVAFRWLPHTLSAEPYLQMWRTIALLHFLVNSVVIASVSTIVAIAMGVFAAHAIIRYEFVGKRTMLYSILATQTFPGILFLLPLFVIYVSIQHATGIGLDGSYLGIILTYLSFTLPFAIWLLVGYLDTVPKEIEEAAMVDGCGPLGAFLRVTLPLAAPGILAVAVFSFIGDWSEVLFASVLTNSRTRTLPIGLELFQNARGVVEWNQLMAAALTISLPIVIAFVALQRYFVRGLSAGAVK